MSPLNLQILLHIHSRADQLGERYADTKTTNEIVEWLKNLKLIESTDTIPKGCHEFKVSPRGKVYIHHLIKLSLPEQKWVMPNETN